MLSIWPVTGRVNVRRQNVVARVAGVAALEACWMEGRDWSLDSTMSFSFLSDRSELYQYAGGSWQGMRTDTVGVINSNIIYIMRVGTALRDREPRGRGPYKQLAW